MNLNRQILVNLLIVFLIGIAIFLGVQYWKVNEDVKINKAKLEGMQSSYDEYKEEAAFRILEKDIEIDALKERAKKYDSLSKSRLASANYFKERYETLKDSGYKIAQTAEDSLKVCLDVSDEMFKEATQLRDGLDKAYVVIRAQTTSIELLEENVEEYKQLLTNEEKMNEMLREHIKLMERKAKTDKLKAGGIGAGIGTVLGIIITLMLI